MDNNNGYGVTGPAPGVTTVWVAGQDNLSPLMNNFGSLSLQDFTTTLPNQFFDPQQPVYNSLGAPADIGLTPNSSAGQYCVVSVKESPTTTPEIQPLAFQVVDSNINVYANDLINGHLHTTLPHQDVMSPTLVTQDFPQTSTILPQTSQYSYVSTPVSSTIPVNGFKASPQMSAKLVYNSTGERTESSSNTDFSSTASSPYGSLPSSPRPDQEPESPTFLPASPNYTRPTNKDICMRCGKKVYAMEKIGPIKYVVYHKLCFRCVVCTSLLNLNTFHFNPNDMEDLNIYCKSHRPKEVKGTLDAESVSIKKALKVPKLDKVNEQVRGGPSAMKGGTLDANSVSIRTALNAPKAAITSPDLLKTTGQAYYFDSEDLKMQHVRNVPATDLQVANKQREQVWSRGERRFESVPPPNVARYSSHEEEQERRSYGYEYVGIPEPDYY